MQGAWRPGQDRDTDEDSAVKGLPTSWCDWRMDIRNSFMTAGHWAAQQRLLEQMIVSWMTMATWPFLKQKGRAAEDTRSNNTARSGNS